jgi:hypothetical protein
MTQCLSTAQVMPGGAIIRCELEAGHDQPTFEGIGHDGPIYRDDATLHRFTLVWGNPEGVEIDPDLYDPDEHFDLEVDIDPEVARHADPLDEAMSFPLGLCALRHLITAERCVYLAGHYGRHSWQH